MRHALVFAAAALLLAAPALAETQEQLLSQGPPKTTQPLPDPGHIPMIFGKDANVSGIEMHFGWLLLVCYFGFFAFLWAYTHFGYEKTKPVPERVTTHA